MSNSKPATQPSNPKPSTPRPNPLYPSTTGNPSGGGRGNTPKSK